jgi:hypothetical protein
MHVAEKAQGIGRRFELGTGIKKTVDQLQVS